MDKYAALDLLMTKAAILKTAEEAGLPPEQVVEAVASSPEAAKAVEEEKQAMLIEIVEDTAMQKIADIPNGRVMQAQREKAYLVNRLAGKHQRATGHIQNLQQQLASEQKAHGATKNALEQLQAEHGGLLASVHRNKKAYEQLAEQNQRNIGELNRLFAQNQKTTGELGRYTGSRLARAGRWLGEHPVKGGLGAGALLAGLGAGGYGLYHAGQTHQKAAAALLAEYMDN